MFRYLIVFMIVASFAASCGSTSSYQLEDATIVPVTDSRSVSAVDATNAWNSVCAQYRFDPKPSDTTTTFAQGYNGNPLTFLIDMTLITNHVNLIVGLQNALPPSTGNDIMKTRIENWGLLGGGL